jgi:hypothetical protein
MPKIISILFAVALTCASVQAQQATSIEIVEYGIYTADKVVRSNTTGPITHSTLESVRHAATTTTIPAQLGVRFGLRYRVGGSTNGATVDVSEITLFPPPGLKSPKSAQPLQKDIDPHKRKVGETTYCGYSLDNAWEMVPGTWTFQIWSGNRMLAEKSFTVLAK